MYLSKSKREALRKQFLGRCAYCGEPLPARGWHAESICRKLVAGGVVPVCPSCRKVKGNASPEAFRALLAEQVERALRHSAHFRTAVRFGLVNQQADNVEFWFQRCGVSGGRNKGAIQDVPARRFLPERALHQVQAETRRRSFWTR
ncbi:hypothetical protein HA45_22505 [Pantoea rodasii]|nr:hypothetical protein HA45_22505 [Pantoea rodasii]